MNFIKINLMCKLYGEQKVKKTCKVNVSSQLQGPVMFLKFFAHKEKCVLVKLSEMRM